MSDNTHNQDNSSLRSLNIWLTILISFIVIWGIGTILFLKQKTDDIANRPVPVVVIDTMSGKIINPAHTNLFLQNMVDVQPLHNATNIVSGTGANKPMYEKRKSYQLYDYVIINYFHIPGIIVDKNGDEYTIMYKDQNHTLQKVNVSKDLLITPTSSVVVNPFSLVID